MSIVYGTGHGFQEYPDENSEYVALEDREGNEIKIPREKFLDWLECLRHNHERQLRLETVALTSNAT